VAFAFMAAAVVRRASGHVWGGSNRRLRPITLASLLVGRRAPQSESQSGITNAVTNLARYRFLLLLALSARRKLRSVRVSVRV
jgi:hypothetical protein